MLVSIEENPNHCNHESNLKLNIEPPYSYD